MATPTSQPQRGPAAPSTGPSAHDRQADLAQISEHPVSLRRIAALFRPHRAALVGVLAMILATSLLGLGTPFLIKELIDVAIPKRNVGLVLTLVGAMLAITLVTQVISVFQTWISTSIGQQVMHRLRTNVFAHLQRMSLSFFTRTSGGELQSRLTNDVNSMQSVVTSSATSITYNVTTAIGTAAAMVALSWKLSLLSLIVLPPSIYLTRRVARMRRGLQTRVQRTLADMQTQIEESLSINGIMVSKTMGSTAALSDRFRTSSEQLTGFEVASQMAGRWRMGSLAIIFAAIPALIYLAAGLPVTGAGISIGTLVGFTALQSQLFRPIMGVLNVGTQIVTSLALFSRIFEYLDLPVEITDPPHPIAVDPETAIGTVRFNDVSLRYPGANRDALSEIDLELPAGSTVAVVGATGSGKTTLASLISRLQDPSRGSVTIDGVDLRDMTLANVAALVGVVAQETYLLHTTIRENLRYAKPDATEEEIVAAARAAQIHDLVTTLPEGYDTIVGARGYRFSGGEKQRIALARTILRDPKILILDEATSALDNNTERAVQAALELASEDRTTLTIAHRLSTVRNADMIVVLDSGRIVEAGHHDKLVALDGRYAELLRASSEQAALGLGCLA